ncbi:hypothetical protein [Tautonia marina]|uniref:hypothetical protein n=1 Tax=Tautonia marina TaxID=2653855 RepID=UPI001260AEFB|nr:hypothetical protein [Tautonia marina]
MEVASKLGGLAAILVGGFMTFMAFGFTTLSGGDRDTPPPSPLIARLLSDDELGPLLFGGILLGLAGLWLAFRKPDAPS